MFKKTRLRIFALIMAAATVIITLMLLVIYISNSYYNMDRSNSLLERYVEGENGGRRLGEKLSDDPLKEERDENAREKDGLKPEKPDLEPGMRPETKDPKNKMVNLATFYSVLYNREGEVVKINCDSGVLYSETEILEISEIILESGKTQGKYSKMPFIVYENEGGIIVALLDNTMDMDNSGKLFIYCLAAGITGWIIILILAWIFSKRIVNPLEQNDAKQKQFISDAGHELKTPISVINANADLLAIEIGENKWLSNIQYENERMGSLVKQLLELNRAENAKPAKEQIDFSRLVSGGTLPFESVAFENGLTLNTDLEENIFVNGNSSQLSQLVSILIDNAISHGNCGKEVSVNLHSVKHNAQLTVVNSGKAIPEEVKDRMFERFYKADEARSDDPGHYGLGLAIAKAIVTAHNGQIEVNCFNELVEFKVVIPKL